MATKQLVTMKGTKEGLVLKLDDQCGFADLLDALQSTKVVTQHNDDEHLEVQIHLGNRYCTHEKLKQLLQVVEETQRVTVSKIKSDVLTVEESNQRVLEHQSSTYIGIVRSGQVLKIEGDIVIIGDVNPNGRVEATGSIFVLGRVKGIVHAGKGGNRNAVIVASWLEATHLMVDDVIELMTNETTILSEHPEMECAYLHDNGHIVIDRLQNLRNIRPNLATFKGGS
ncbi:septum site-determining protein MinC [Kurthia massiliensis]|uniref:septum site-determining protein MinC n=1 Tax=Kurthia massiliensis TaxID=1033739 RepID=UPI0002895E7B|nr:septum site-determining protein MinC [Kurthia massiliensis]